MEIQSLAEQFWEDGYLSIPGFFDAELMDRYQALILDYYGASPEYFHNNEFLSLAKTEVIPWFPQREGVDAFDEVQCDERLVALSEAILGQSWQALYCMVMYSLADTAGQAWHQDCPPEQPSRFNLNRLVYTEDVDPEHGGGTIVVPGSHRRGPLPASAVDQDFEGQVHLQPCKGQLVILHGHCWHKVLPVTGRYRVSTNYRAAPAGTPEDITDICVYPNMRYQFSTNQVVEDRLSG